MTRGRTTTAPRPHVTGAGVLAAAIWCSIAVAAWSQTIKIPDFRQAPPPVATFRAGETCQECGRIMSIREIQTERRVNIPQVLRSDGQPGSQTGPTGSNLVGAVIYLPLGGDTTQKPYVGGVGTPEMQERFRESTYEIGVRLDDGSLRLVQRQDGTRYQVGDRVRLAGGNQLELVLN